MADQKRQLFDGLIRIHVLVHAAQEPIFGLAMMKELAHHGYSIGPGTLYPLLHGLEKPACFALRSIALRVGDDGSIESHPPEDVLSKKPSQKSTNSTTNCTKSIRANSIARAVK